MTIVGILLTSRMRLVPTTVELARAEIKERSAFGALLGATVPTAWPPEQLADALPFFLRQLEAAPGQVGWFGWYGILRGAEVERDTLAASGGFMGPPVDGTVEIGYSVLPEYQRGGVATEMVEKLANWALSHAEVRCIRAEIHQENTPSLRLVRRLGFLERGAGEEPEYLRFELCRASGTP